MRKRDARLQIRIVRVWDAELVILLLSRLLWEAKLIILLLFGILLLRRMMWEAQPIVLLLKL